MNEQTLPPRQRRATGKRILGLVTSLRPGGNSDALTRVALRAAAARGAQTDLVFLGDLRLNYCDGCLACVFHGGQCRHDDDVHWLYETASGYDGIILSSGTYLLAPPAQVKTLLDRGVAEFARHPDRVPRPVGVICVAGLNGWDYLVRPMVNQLAFLLGGRLVGSLIGYAPGPSEALLDAGLVRQVEELGQAVVEDRVLPAPEGVCPVCYFPRPSALSGDGTGGECPFCRYDPERPGAHRFTAASLADFVGHWMLPSRDRFLARRDEVRKARTALGEFEVQVRRPARDTGSAPLPAEDRSSRRDS